VALLAAHCERGAQSQSEDVVLGVGRTLGFVELQGPIPSPGETLEPWTESVELRGATESPRDPTHDAQDAGGAVALSADPVVALDTQQRAQTASTLVADSSRWHVLALRAVHARALDVRGQRFAVTDDAVVDERTEHSVPLTRDEVRCDRRRESLQFNSDGAGYLLREGRVYVRAPAMDFWTRTPVCNDVAGAPWSFSNDRGWFAIARRTRAREAALLTTRDIDGSFGWNALQALRADLTSAAIETDLSQTVLIDGSKPLVVNNAQLVAGPIQGTADTAFGGIERNRVGVVVWRDVGSRRELFYAHDARGPYTRQLVERAPGLTSSNNITYSVWPLTGGGYVALTKVGVEACEGGPGAVFQRMVRWPSPLLTGEGCDVEMLSTGVVMVVTPQALASNER
jgi:hypothetical protein